jgi:hypothetical protein
MVGFIALLMLRLRHRRRVYVLLRQDQIRRRDAAHGRCRLMCVCVRHAALCDWKHQGYFDTVAGELKGRKMTARRPTQTFFQICCPSPCPRWP